MKYNFAANAVVGDRAELPGLLIVKTPPLKEGSVMPPTPDSSNDLVQPSVLPVDFSRFPPPAFKLVIWGTRWNNPAVRRYLERARIADRVIRTGFLKEQEAVAFYNYAASFLFPSLVEGFGMPNLEAMACGCPVITSNAFAIPE